MTLYVSLDLPFCGIFVFTNLLESVKNINREERMRQREQNKHKRGTNVSINILYPIFRIAGSYDVKITRSREILSDDFTS